MIQERNTQDMWRDVPTLIAAAHELKSPLVLIRQLALQLEDEGANTIAERIRLTSERSLALVEALTRAARLEDALFDCEPIHIGVLYDEVAHELYPLSKALGQSISVVAPASSQLVVVGNQELLRSLLIGLCDNALAHNDPAFPIVLGAKRSANRIISSVRDHGPATAQLSTIRRRLGISPQPISARPRSSGLGLLIADQFARHMDASLQLRRHRECGATFSVSLPASQQLSLLAL